MSDEATKTSKNEATHIFQTLWRTYRTLLSRADESKKRLGLGDSDFRVLEALYRRGTLPVNIIGETVDLTTGSITTAIDRLEAKWLVVRKHHHEDRRIRMVELTARGRKLIEKACVQYALDLERSLQGLSREDRRSLVDLLIRVGEVAEDQSQAASVK
jgi:MarR family 2-MHQ and catechol resistance regulon transcriptional repressor